MSQVTGNVVVFAGGGGGGAIPAPLQLAATDVIFAPAGSIAARNVQGAIEELDAEKLDLDGGAMTGLLILSGHPTDDLGAATKWYVDNLDRLLVPGNDGVPVVRLLPDFVRIGHPLQPGLTWSMAEGLRLPAVCVVGMIDRFTAFVANPLGAAAGTMGAVHYIAESVRLSTIAVAMTENTYDGTAIMLVVAAASVAGLNGTEASAVVGRISIPAYDAEVLGQAEDYVIDSDTGDYVSSGVNYVVTGDDPLLPAGSWLAVWDGINMDYMTNVTVTILGRRV